MVDAASRDVTQLLIDWREGDEDALATLMPLVYEELRRQAERYMRRERRDHTLQPTALVHETYLQLVDQNRVQWQNRAQFFGVAAGLMRRIMLKHARGHKTEKRGGRARRVPLDPTAAKDRAAVKQSAEELIALDEALERLAAFDPRQSKILELRHFGGLTIDEAAVCLEVSPATVKREARLAQAWLKRELTAAGPSGG